MIIKFPKKREEETEDIAEFYILYTAHLELKFTDYKGDFDLFLEGDFWPRLYKVLMAFFSTFMPLSEVEGGLYMLREEVTEEDLYVDMEEEEIYIKIPVYQRRRLDLSPEEKTEFFFKGDAWMAQNKMEDLSDFLSQVYAFQEGEGTVRLDKMMKSLGFEARMELDSFEAYGLILVEEGYDYLDAF